MGTHRTPKGSYVRPTADFYIDRAASAGALVSVVQTNIVPCIDLYNNATDGSYLHVYGVNMSTGGAGPAALRRLSGHGANLLGGNTPVIITAGALPGVLYWDKTAATVIWPSGVAPDGGTDVAPYYFNDLTSAVDYFNFGGPLCVIPPGYSLRALITVGFTTGTTTYVLAASFYWCAIPDRG